MPLVTQSVMGSTSTAASMVNRQLDITLGGAGAFTSGWLDVNQMPQLRLYARQTAGAAPATITLQMAVRGGDVAGGLTALPLAAGTVLPALNVPLILQYSFPCAFIRVDIGGAVGDAITIVFGASGP